MEEIELEKTYLAKYIPDLTACEYKEMSDTYLPESANHPVIRIRKQGETYMITKKAPVGDNAAVQKEQTIYLTKQEYDDLLRISNKKVEKIRYYYQVGGRKVEIDVFQGALCGLILIDVEFSSEQEMNVFEMPEFCLVEVTHESFIAGGLLAGKSYQDIGDKLTKYNYSPLFFM